MKLWFRREDSNLNLWVQSPASCPLNDPGTNKKAAFFKGGFGLAKLIDQTTLWPAILPIQRLRIHKREDSPACLDRCRDRHGLMSWFEYANHGCRSSIPSRLSLPQLRRLVKKKLKIDKKLVLPHELSLHTLKYPIKIYEPDANRIDGAHGGVRRSSHASPRNFH